MNLPLAIGCARTIEALYANDIGSNVVDPLSDTQVLVEKLADGKFAVIFPGTASARDWLTDLEVRKVNWGGASVLASRVHRGFANAYASVREGIVKILPPGVSLIIAGHSLGGALATLCADDFNVQPSSFIISDVITFGSPRVGNGPFVRAYNSDLADRTVRLVNAGDPVAHVPWICGTYRHVHTQHYLTDDGEVKIDAALTAHLLELKDTVLQVRANPAAAFTLAKPHGISEYRKKLEALA